MGSKAYLDFLKFTGRDNFFLPLRCCEYGFLCGKNGSNNGVLPKPGNRKIRGNVSCSTQLCLWTSWLPLSCITRLFGTVGM